MTHCVTKILRNVIETQQNIVSSTKEIVERSRTRDISQKERDKKMRD